MTAGDPDWADAIYASALEPALWPDALSNLSRKLGVVAATISVKAAKSEELFPTGHDVPRNDFLQFWQSKSIMQPAVERRSDGRYCDWEMFSPETIDRDPYYQEFRRAYGVRHIVGSAVTLGDGQRIRFSAHMPLGRTPQDCDFLDDFDDISRHVLRAFGLSYRLNSQRSFAGGFGDEVFRSPHAAAVLDASGQVVIANDRFASLAQDGLRIVDRRLCCSKASQQAALDEVVRGALDRTIVTLQTLALVHRPSGRRPFVVRAIPLSRLHREIASADGLRSSHALVLVMDLDAKGYVGSEKALRVLGLTAAECRIANLIGTGLSPRDIAERLRLTEGTVRTRLKGMFSKLGLSRQSELTNIVTRIQMFDGGS